MLFYQIKIALKPYKTDEFVQSMRSFVRKIRREEGCLDCSVYRDCEKDNTFSVMGKWRTRPAMEKHFKTQNFEVLIGAARVLGETFEMNIAEGLKTGGFELAKKQIASQKKGGRSGGLKISPKCKAQPLSSPCRLLLGDLHKINI